MLLYIHETKFTHFLKPHLIFILFIVSLSMSLEPITLRVFFLSALTYLFVFFFFLICARICRRFFSKVKKNQSRDFLGASLDFVSVSLLWSFVKRDNVWRGVGYVLIVFPGLP